jgi:release factor glutamine methyltransferase
MTSQPTTLRDLLRQIVERLARAGIEAPRADAEWLLAHVLRVGRTRLALEQDRTLEAGQRAQIEQLVARRERREPLQHLLGTAPFLDLELVVNRHVLVPRPETEVLAGLALTLLPPSDDPGLRRRIADIGTGSGCLALAVASARCDAEVHAIDVSAQALVVARENAHRLGLASAITFHDGNCFAVMPYLGAFDLIVSNPPYIPTGELAGLEPEVRDFDPVGALDGGVDGLDFYRRFAGEAAGWLRPGGWLAMEFGDGQAAELVALFGGPAWTEVRVEKDLSGRERVLIVRRPVG